MITNELLPKCVCGSVLSSGRFILGVEVRICSACGVHRQAVAMTEAELAEWYRTEYLSEKYYHSYEQDLAVARTRLKAYNLAPKARLLDVGCANGAFIAAAREQGIEAWGQDLSAESESEFAYVGSLESIGFPTDSFDVVTVHDVLEHVPDPMAMLKEIRRVLRRPGKLIIDFPRFWVPEGDHHWKCVEHLWMFTPEELRAVLDKAGFVYTAHNFPIPSKVVVEAEPAAETRPQVLVPPGIGDAYWSITKLPGFLRENGLDKTVPDVWVQDSGGPKRTQPFLRCLPSIHAAGYKAMSDRSPVFREAYLKDGRTVFPGTTHPDVASVDYFIAYNGILRFGKSLEEVDPEFGCEWRPKIHVSKAALLMKERLQGPGRYILTYYAEAGMYRRWLAEFAADKIAESLRMLRQTLDCRVLFMGAPWDQGQVGRKIAQMDEGFEDLIGATSFDQMLGAIMGAEAVVGFPAGNTMLATVLNRPTVLLWNSYFDQRFWTNACPPDAPYRVLDTKDLTPQVLHRTVLDTIAHGR